MRLRARTGTLLLVCLLYMGCQTDVTYTPSDANPWYTPEMTYPNDNKPHPARVVLGRRLFFEKALSVDSSLSCASCHKPEHAFADNHPTTPGVMGRNGRRNVPTLTNIGYAPYFTREGGVPTLEMQVLVPIQEHNEFGFNVVKIVERLEADSLYRAMSQRAYQRDFDAFVLVRALAAYERTLVSAESPFDAYYYQGKANAISANAKAGWALFKSERLACATCHSDFDFTNHAFENNGLYETYADAGRFRLTGDSADVGLFKVPTLRNIALTGPYMHNGSLASLRDVVEHYNRGGQQHAHQSSHIKPLGLTSMEKRHLVAFLESLTDSKFLEEHKEIQYEN